MAGLDLRSVVVAAVGHRLQGGLAHGLSCSLRHRAELRPVASDVGHLVGDDQVVLGVHCGLDVVADDASGLAVRGHRAGVGVSQRELAIGLRLQLLLCLVELAHLPPQSIDLVLQPLRLGLQVGRLGAVGGLERIEVALDALFDLLLALVDLAGREVAVTAVDGLELAPIDGDERLGEELEVSAQHDEAPADVADAGAVVAAEVGNGLEVGLEVAKQPDHLEVPPRFCL